MQIIQTSHPVLMLPERLAACLPIRLVDAIRKCGASTAEELRLHRGRIATVTCKGRTYPTNIALTESEMNEIFRRMCAGSLYAFQETVNNGYLAMDGGIRVGVCGSASMEAYKIIGVHEITGLIVRIPHHHHISVKPILSELERQKRLQGILIYAPPGVGKTTVLRAVAGEASAPAYGLHTVVVDTREELGYALDNSTLSLDVLVGYPRQTGIEIAVRSLGAELIVCDEISSEGDAKAILMASSCGVPLIASAHAGNVKELLNRPFMRILHRFGVFGCYIGLQRDPYGGFFYQVTHHASASHAIG